MPWLHNNFENGALVYILVDDLIAGGLLAEEPGPEHNVKIEVKVFASSVPHLLHE